MTIAYGCVRLQWRALIFYPLHKQRFSERYRRAPTVSLCMEIRWDKGPPRQALPRIPVQIWNVPKGLRKERPAYARLLGDWVSAWVHWDYRFGIRSSACTVPTCNLCPDRSFRMGYAPALLWVGDEGNTQKGWLPIICPLPDRVMDALEGQDASGVLLAFWREGNHRKSWIGFRIEEKGIKDQSAFPFDVVSTLRRVWNREDRQRQLDQRADAIPPGPAAPPPSPEVNGQAEPPPQLPPPPRPVPPPPRPTSSAPAPALASEIRAILAKAQEAQKGHLKPYVDEKPAVLPFRAVETPPEPVKPARRRKKGGAS